MGCKLLGELCSFYRGSSIPRARMYDSGDYLYIHYGDLYKGFDLRIDVESPQKPIPYIISNERIKDTQWLRDQDIVYVLTSETVDGLGNSFLFNNPQELPAVAGTETTIVRVDRRDLLVPAFLNYLMQTPRFKLLLRQYVKGMKVFRVHPSDLARIEIELPALSVQRKIVALCDAIFEKQLLNQRTNDYLELCCQTLFDDIQDDRTNEMTQLSDVAVVNPKRRLLKGSLARCVEMTNLSTSGSFPNDWSKKAYNGGMKFMNGDTILARITPCLENGKTAYINFLDEGEVAFGSTEYIVLTSKGFLPTEFFYFLARNRAFVGYATSHMNGSSGRQRVSAADIEAYRLRVPSSRQMVRFVDFVQPAMEKILSLSLENKRLASLRDALLPKLMSGEIDVSKVELPTQLNNHLCVD